MSYKLTIELDGIPATDEDDARKRALAYVEECGLADVIFFAEVVESDSAPDELTFS